MRVLVNIWISHRFSDAVNDLRGLIAGFNGTLKVIFFLLGNVVLRQPRPPMETCRCRVRKKKARKNKAIVLSVQSLACTVKSRAEVQAIYLFHRVIMHVPTFRTKDAWGNPWCEFLFYSRWTVRILTATVHCQVAPSRATLLKGQEHGGDGLGFEN